MNIRKSHYSEKILLNYILLRGVIPSKLWHLAKYDISDRTQLLIDFYGDEQVVTLVVKEDNFVILLENQIREELPISLHTLDYLLDILK